MTITPTVELNKTRTGTLNEVSNSITVYTVFISELHTKIPTRVREREGEKWYSCCVNFCEDQVSLPLCTHPLDLGRVSNSVHVDLHRV